MRSRQALRLALQSILRGRRTFALSVFGIAVGISSLAFFLALSAGVQRRVLSRLFPAGRLEVVPARSSLGLEDLGGLGGLLGGPPGLTAEAVAALVAQPGVAAVHPRMKAAFPIRGWGGEAILGRPVYAELILDGVDPGAVREATGPIPFADHGGKPGTFCINEKGCQAPAYCAWDVNRCELPVPVLISPTLLELYNGSIARTRHLPRIGSFLASQLRGMTITAELGRSFVNRNHAEGQARQRRLMLVGISDRAMPIGLTVPLPYVMRWNAEYGGPAAAGAYSSLSIELAKGASVTRVVEAVRRLGYAVEDNGAEQAGLAVTLLTAVFLLVSLSIMLLAGVNIAHSFFRAVSERRRELGVMRAVGASGGDLQVLLLVESAIVGLLGGGLGLGLAVLFASGIDFLSRRFLPDFPFKPDSYFWFSPGLCLLALAFSILACLAGAYLPARAAAKMNPAAVLSG